MAIFNSYVKLPEGIHFHDWNYSHMISPQLPTARWRTEACWGEDATLLRFLDRALACESSRLLWQLEDYAAPEAGATWSCSTLQSLDLRISRKTYWVKNLGNSTYTSFLCHIWSHWCGKASNKPIVLSGDDVYTPHLFPPDSGKSLGMVYGILFATFGAWQPA